MQINKNLYQYGIACLTCLIFHVLSPVVKGQISHIFKTDFTLAIICVYILESKCLKAVFQSVRFFLEQYILTAVSLLKMTRNY